MEGVLRWKHEGIEAIRWHGPVIECLVRFHHHDEPSWEDLHHFATWQHLDQIRSFYHRLFWFGQKDPHRQLGLIKQAPKPEEIVKVLRPLMDSEQPVRLLRRWRRNCRPEDRDGAIKDLEGRIRWIEIQRRNEQNEKIQREALDNNTD